MDVTEAPAAACDNLIATRDLSRTYQMCAGVVPAVRDVHLTVASGEFVAIVGVSGSGKSTLLHLLGGLDTPSAGEIEVAGRRLSGLSARQLTQYRRDVVGFVFQSFHLVPHLTALGNVELALTFHGVYGRERNTRAREALGSVGLEARAGHRPSQLSGGEQQRVAVARAIVHRPRLLLADEPTANLDTTNSTHLMQLLRQVNRGTGTTIVLVTHNEQLAMAHCDRVFRMQDGRLLDAQTQQHPEAVE